MLLIKLIRVAAVEGAIAVAWFAVVAIEKKPRDSMLSVVIVVVQAVRLVIVEWGQ